MEGDDGESGARRKQGARVRDDRARTPTMVSSNTRFTCAMSPSFEITSGSSSFSSSAARPSADRDVGFLPRPGRVMLARRIF